LPRASPTCPFLGKEALNHSPLGRISFSLKQQSKSIDVGLLDSVHRGLRTGPVGPIAQVDELGAGARGGLPSAWAAVAASWRGPRAAVERNPATVGALVRCRASRNLSPQRTASGGGGRWRPWRLSRNCRVTAGRSKKKGPGGPFEVRGGNASIKACPVSDITPWSWPVSSGMAERRAALSRDGRGDHGHAGAPI